MESFPSSHSACAGGLLALPLLSPPTSHTPFPPGQNISPRFWFLHGHKTLGLPEGCLYIQQHFWRRDKLQFLHNKELRELHPSFRGLGFCLFSGKQLGHISPAHPIKPNRVPKNPKFQPGTQSTSPKCCSRSDILGNGFSTQQRSSLEFTDSRDCACSLAGATGNQLKGQQEHWNRDTARANQGLFPAQNERKRKVTS